MFGRIMDILEVGIDAPKYRSDNIQLRILKGPKSLRIRLYIGLAKQLRNSIAGGGSTTNISNSSYLFYIQRIRNLIKKWRSKRP